MSKTRRRTINEIKTLFVEVIAELDIKEPCYTEQEYKRIERVKNQWMELLYLISEVQAEHYFKMYPEMVSEIAQ
jgi:hypothetical protein